jgi:hypothetical protein
VFHPAVIRHVRSMAYVTTRDWFAWHQHYDDPRRADVAARLVELDPRNAGLARAAAERAALPGVEVVTGTRR